MRAKRNGREQRSVAQWRELMDRYQSSGESQAVFCKEAGIALSTFQLWRSKLGLAGRVEEFVEVTPSREFNGGWTLEIEFPDGTVTRVRG